MQFHTTSDVDLYECYSIMNNIRCQVSQQSVRIVNTDKR
jgi:hypothetical protein